MMKQKVEIRRKRLEKVAQLRGKIDEAKEKEGTPDLSKRMMGMFSLKRRRTIIIPDAPDDNDELMKRLRAWKLKKKEYEMMQFL